MEIVATIQIRTQISNTNSIYIKNWLNFSEIGRKWLGNIFNLVFYINQLLIDFYDLLIDYFDLLIKLLDLFIDLLIDLLINLLIELDQIQIKKDWFYIEIAIVDSDSSLDFESDRNWRSNSDTDFDSTTMIWFATPNRISLKRIHDLF